MINFEQHIHQLTQEARAQAQQHQHALAFGTLRSFDGRLMVAEGLQCAVGDLCRIGSADSHQWAQVISFSEEQALLLPFELKQSLGISTRLYPSHPDDLGLPAGSCVLGQIVNGMGISFNETPLPEEVKRGEHVSLRAPAKTSLKNQPSISPLQTGIRAIDALLTIGTGQRVGFAASRRHSLSFLLSQLAEFSQADRLVILLSGRSDDEIARLYHQLKEANAHEKTVIIVSPLSGTEVFTLQSFRYAQALAADYVAHGHDTLLMVDAINPYLDAALELQQQQQQKSSLAAFETLSPSSCAANLLSNAYFQASDASLTTFYGVHVPPLENMNTNHVTSLGSSSASLPLSFWRGLMDQVIVLSHAQEDDHLWPAFDLLLSSPRYAFFERDEEGRSLNDLCRHILSLPDQAPIQVTLESYLHSGRSMTTYCSIKERAVFFMRQSPHQKCSALHTRAMLTSLIHDFKAHHAHRT